jgi:hypothetical protein
MGLSANMMPNTIGSDPFSHIRPQASAANLLVQSLRRIANKDEFDCEKVAE